MTSGLREKNMTSGLEKNMLLKKKLLDKKVGPLKSIVYRHVQLTSFIMVVKDFLNSVEDTSNSIEKKRFAKHLFEYLCRTTDMWVSYPTFKSALKLKAFELSKEDNDFEEYLLKFGWICPYPKRDGMICGKRHDGLCKVHKKCEERLKERIRDNPELPPELSNIVFEYALPYVKI